MRFKRAFLPVSVWIFVSLFFFGGCLILDLDDDDVRNNDFVASETFSFDVAVQNHVLVRLVAVNGVVEVAGRPTASSVRITGERQVGSESLRDAENHLDDLQVRVEDLVDEVFIQTRQPQQAQGRNYVVNYTITLPRDLEVVVNQINGNITVESIDNRVSVDNINGNIGLADIFGSTSVMLVNGNIGSEVTLPLNGTLSHATTNGNIDLVIPKSTSAEFSASVTNGNIQTTNLVLRNPVSSSRSLQGMLGDAEGTVDLRTVNGNIEVSGRE